MITQQNRQTRKTKYPVFFLFVNYITYTIELILRSYERSHRLGAYATPLFFSIQIEILIHL